MNQQGLRSALWLVLIQFCITLVLACISALFSEFINTLSILLGGLVSALPSIGFSLILFRNHGARKAQKIVRDFYKGEAFKIILSVILFVLVFKFFNINPLVFFITYCVMQLTNWFAPLIFAPYNK